MGSFFNLGQSNNTGDNNSVTSAGDSEDDPPDETDPLDFPDIDDEPRSQPVTWNIKDIILQSLDTWSFIRWFKQSFRPRVPSMGAHPLAELREVEDRNHAEPKLPGTYTRQLLAMLSASWVNILLIFVPVGGVTYVLEMSPLLVFTCNAIAIVPLSALLTAATEGIAAEAGDTIGALLNISFGNIVELILFIALANNQIRVVQASILGSILVNLLLILGSALVVNGMTDLDPICNTVEAQLLSCLLFVSVFVILMPTAFAYTVNGVGLGKAATLKMSRISALMVLLIYVLYFVHEITSLKKKRETTDIEGRQGLTLQRIPTFERTPTFERPPTIERTSTIERPSSGSFPRPGPVGPPTLPPRTIRFADEDDAHAPGAPRDSTETERTSHAESEDDDASEYRGRKAGGESHISSHPNSYQPLLRSRQHSRSLSLSSGRGFHSRDSSLSGDRRGLAMTLQILRDNRADMEYSAHTLPLQHGAATNRAACVTVLIVSSLVMSMNSEFLVNTIDDVVRDGGVSESLIGLVILPIVGNVAEYTTVVSVAARDKLDLAIAVAVGSAIQISLCVAPLTVMAGWALQRDLGLTFDFFEMATLMGSALLVNLLVLSEGTSNLRVNGFKGGLISVCYMIFVLGAWLAPQSTD
ncbi:related to Ca2+/H+-exchanging protein, vacuolar [Cephalotrichum gorgonifer]|uniref:Related to Ca2+/H+-exchanging protein, vacuolar n=1 Tax=Cephalotrichum gorgonifer TaxID=2041049 RepID=A0AAE8ST04_9PEZI|nr:related to Ca2+/H+-exchanging protein, vacuolar [Cephalotrichum gorgonifer]